MEDATSSLIRRGCELVGNLQSNFSSLATQPDRLSMSIDKIVMTFSAAKESLKFSQHQSPISSSFAHKVQQPHQIELPVTSAQPMDQSIQMQRPRASQTLKSPSRLRKRKSDSEKRTVRVAAPSFGNMEIPPDDGFTWRKYGQKDIFGSKYPRSYYRCTHQKLYDCQAKRQVQRVDENPKMFEITYRGTHTCIMSSTAPSSIPPSQLLVDISQHNNMPNTQSTISPQLSSTSTSVSQWLSPLHPGLYGGAATTPAGVDAATASGGPSTSRYGTSADYMVADMADAMFNSTGSCTGNGTMESLFLFTEDKWEPRDKKS